jgi:hypothetical protein
MSSIPSSAMPHAAPAAEPEIQAEEGETMTLARRATEQAGRLAELARDNPKAAIAAGAAVAAGIAAAAAIPMVRAARRKGKTAAAGKSETAAAKPQPRRRAPARKSPKKS